MTGVRHSQAAKGLPFLVGGGILFVGLWGLCDPAEPPQPALPVDPPGGGVGQGASGFRSERPLALAGDRAAAAHEPADPLAVTEPVAEPWSPAPDSPIALLDAQAWWHHYEPTLENMAKQIRAVPKYGGLTDEELRRAWETPGFQEAWRLNREHLALRTFLVGYQQREYDRWYAGRPSVALETELTPVVGFLSNFPDPDRAWTAIEAYSTQVINAIHAEGEDQPKRDDVDGKWALMEAFTTQAETHTLLVEQILDEL